MDQQNEPRQAPSASADNALNIEGPKDDVGVSNCEKILEPGADATLDGAIPSSHPISSMLGEENADGPEEASPSLPLQQNVDSSSVAPERQEDLTLTFPQQLMEILSRDEEHGDIISWLPHGRGFMIYKKKQFETDVMPKYFNKHSKYTSFTRKLNRWGFTRITRGAEMGAYYNPRFQRGEEKMCMEMTCQRPGGGTGGSNEATTSTIMSGQNVPHHMMVGGTANQATVPFSLIGGGAIFPNHQQGNTSAWQQLPQQQQMQLLMNQREALWRSQFPGGGAAGASMVTNAATRQLLQQSMGRVGSGGGQMFWNNGGAGNNPPPGGGSATNGGGGAGNNLPGIHPMILNFGVPSSQNQQHRQQSRFPGPPPM